MHTLGLYRFIATLLGVTCNLYFIHFPLSYNTLILKRLWPPLIFILVRGRGCIEGIGGAYYTPLVYPYLHDRSASQIQIYA